MTTNEQTVANVLVAVDGSSDSDKALEWAQDYAGAMHADLTLITAWRWPSSYGSPVSWDGWQPEEDAQNVADKAAAGLTLPADRVHVVVEQGIAADVLVRHSHAAALLVVGSRGHGGLVGAVIGSTSAHCVHHAACPIVVVR
jgi:nucleotide-binding universal stress UspA family protein